MALIFVMTFNGIGAWLTSGMEGIVGAITDALDAGLTAAGVNPVMHAPVIVFLTFVLLYTPCVAAIATVKRESGGRNAVYTVITQCAIAWLVAFVVHLFGTAIGLH